MGDEGTSGDDIGSNLPDALQRIAEIVASNEVGVALLAPEGNVLWVNRAFERTTGYSLAELKGNIPRNLLRGPQSSREYCEGIDRAIQLAERYRGESYAYRKGGEAYWASVTIEPAFEGDRHVGFVTFSTDQTERHRVEQALEFVQSSDRYWTERMREAEENRQALKVERDLNDAILRAAGSLIVVLDPTGRIVRFNQECERLTGFTSEELRACPTYEVLVPPSERKQVREAIRKAVDERITTHSDNHWITRTGDLRLIRWANSGIVDEGGVKGYVVAVGIDVTERRKTEELLRESQRLAKLGSWEIDLRTTRVDWSVQTFALFNRDPSLGPPNFAEFIAMLSRDDRKSVRAALRDASQDGSLIDLEMTMDGENGPRFLRVLGQPTWDRSRIIRIHGSIQDVTVEKIISNRLVTQEAFLRNVIDTDPNFIFVKDHQGRFVLANRAVAAAYGTTPEDLVGKTDRDFNPNEDEVEHFRRIDQSVIETGKGVFTIDEALSSVDGPMWLHTVKCPIVSPDTGERQVLGISVDITERVRNERELERAREAALESSRMKSAFLANMSHEIRTPMNGVIGMVDLLRETKLDPEQSDLVRTIRDSAESLLAILNDVLDFSKIEAGKMSLEALPVDLADLLERTAVSFALRAQEKGLRFQIEIDWGQSWTYVTDPVRLRQILTNLIGNAVKFTETGLVRVVLERSEGLPRIEVRDTGIGIEPERLATIFGAFTQADESTTRKFGGTGLGLAIAQRLSTLLNGRLEVESTPFKGSCFCLELDIERVSTFDEEGRLGGKTIAIRFEEAALEQQVSGALASLGAHVVKVGEPCDAAVVDARRNPSIPGGPVVALMRRGSSMPAGLSEAIYEPVTRRAILDSLLRAMGARTGRERTKLRSGKVLLVEDNPVNQRVAIRLLSLMGLTVEVAENGVDAVHRSAEGGLDVILMDVQMPEMDGLEATRRIRERDDPLGRHIPIIAMTAHAMQGDRERCLATGMDDYISKPLRREDLEERITAWLDVPEDPAVGELDGEYLAHAFGDDVEFLKEVFDTYVQSSEVLVAQMRESLQADDLPAVRTIAHTLKGSSRSIGANVFADRCQSVETADSPERTTEAATYILKIAPRLLSALRTRLRMFGPG